MWEIEKLCPASSEARNVADTLRAILRQNELNDSRLPDFVVLSSIFGQTCLPFREHNLETFVPYICQTLRNYGEKEVIIFHNPLYCEGSTYVGSVNLRETFQVNLLVSENMFSGGFVIATASSRFLWVGNFTDFGFMFTDAAVIEEIFQEPALTVYTHSSREFRMGEGGDSLLDPEIRKLDRLWSLKSQH